MYLVLLCLLCIAGNVSLLIFGARATSKENRILSQVLPMLFFLLMIGVALPAYNRLVPLHEQSFDDGLTQAIVLPLSVFVSTLLMLIIGWRQDKQQKDKNVTLSVALLTLPLLLLFGTFGLFALAPGGGGGFLFVAPVVHVLVFLYNIGRKAGRKWKSRGKKEVETNEELQTEEKQEPV